MNNFAIFFILFNRISSCILILFIFIIETMIYLFKSIILAMNPLYLYHDFSRLVIQIDLWIVLIVQLDLDLNLLSFDFI